MAVAAGGNEGLSPFVDFKTKRRTTMDGENRTPDKTIGEVAHAEEQTEHTKEEQREKEVLRSNPDRAPTKKKTGEF